MIKKILLTLQIIIGVVGFIWYAYISWVTNISLDIYFVKEILLDILIFTPLVVGGIVWMRNKTWGKIFSIIGYILLLIFLIYGYYLMRTVFIID